MTSTIDHVRALVRSALAEFGSTAEAEALRLTQARLDEPLRVAIAGKVKAGKSTLLNALVGEELAATDAGECTRIVTWYQQGLRNRVTVHPHTAEPFEARYEQREGAIDVDLRGYGAEDIARLVVDWPSAALQKTTLIDTPGIASLSAEVSQRTHDALVSENGTAEADAVLFLMRHAHASDVAFLEAFHTDEAGSPTPVNAIGLLSRADELDGASLGSLESAARIAARYRADTKIRRLCQTVIPVAALLAQAGATLREAEFRSLVAIAALPKAERERLLLSADRFANSTSVVSAAERTRLLARYGLFGVRFAVAQIDSGHTATASALSTALINGSGLRELRSLLATRFAARADVLKARSALATVDAVVHRLGATSSVILTEIERIQSVAHDFAEMRLLNAMRTADLGLTNEEVGEIERLIGAVGSDAFSRAGHEAGSTIDGARGVLMDAVSRWRRRAESPLSSRALVEAARVVVRSCEGALAELGVSR